MLRTRVLVPLFVVGFGLGGTACDSSSGGAGACVAAEAAGACGATASGAGDGPGAHLWSRSFGDTEQQFAQGVALDACGNAYVTGYLFGRMEFGTGIPLLGTETAYVAKLDGSGKGVYSKQFGNHGSLAHDIAADPCGNVVLAGTFSGDMNFGAGQVKGGVSDLFVVQLDPQGEHVWSRTFPGDLSPFGPVVAFGPGGEVIVAGDFRDEIDLGDGPVDSKGGYKSFLLKLSSGGEHVWSKVIGQETDQTIIDVAVDAEGSVVVYGLFRGTLDLGGDPLAADPAAAGFDHFVAKFDASGNHLWSRGFGGNVEKLSGGVTVDGAGAIYVAGDAQAPLSFGEDLVGAEGFQTFVAKLSADGGYEWSHVYTGGSAFTSTAVAVGADGKVRVAGVVTATVDFGGGPRTPVDNALFLLTLDGKGAWVWDREWEMSSGSSFLALAVDPSGASALTGEYFGTLDFGGGPFTAQPYPLVPGLLGPDVFVAKIGP